MNKLVLWSKEWLLPFNTDKYNILHFGKNNPNIEYSMDEKLISASRTIKDLGIIFEYNFKFEEHMGIIFKNANSKLGIIKNTFNELTIDNFIILYKALVRPILEYCCTTWAPHFIKDHKEIEKVQKRATKLVKSISHLPYGERLKKLNLTTLYYRRQRADVLQVFRIIKGIDKLDIGNFFELNCRPSRYNSLKLIKPRALTSHKQFSFSHRVINNWNELPDSVVLSDNLNIFKRNFDLFWKDKDFKYEEK